MLSFHILNKTSTKLALSAVFAASLVACGGNFSSSTLTKSVASIVIADPYAVCTSVTVGGVAATRKTTAAGVPYYEPAAGSTGAVVATGCTDQTTGVKLSDMQGSGDKASAGGLETVSPVTTLVQQFIKNAMAGGTAPAAAKADAEAKVAAFLGLPVADLGKDPVSTPNVLQATAKLTATIDLLKSAGANVAETLNNISREIAKPLAAGAPANAVNTLLSSPAFLTAITTPTATTANPNPTSSLSSTKLDLVAQVSAKVVTTISSTSTTSTNVVSQIASIVDQVNKSVGTAVANAAKAEDAGTPIDTTLITNISNTASTAVEAEKTTPTVTAPSVVVPPVVIITGAAV